MTRTSKTILLLLISSASVIATFITPELSIISNVFGISEADTSRIMTFYLLGYLVGQVVFSYLSRKIGFCFSIRYGLFIAIIGALFQLASIKYLYFTAFILSRFITALGLSAGLVCGFAVIKETFAEKDIKKYLSLVAITFTSSIYLSIFISGLIIYYFDVSFIFKMILIYVIALFSLSFLIPASNTPHKTHHVSIKKIGPFLDLKLIAYSLALSITTIISYCYAFYAPFIVIKTYGLSPSTFGGLNLINMAAIFLGSFLYIILNKQYNEKIILIFSLSFVSILSSLFFTIYFSLTSKPLLVFFIISFCLNLCSGLIYPAATYKAMERGNCKAKTSAIMNMIKLGMPTISIAFSSIISKSNIINLSTTIMIFSLSYVLILTMSTNGLKCKI